MLHDIGWPYGRRDLYYDPETIPDSYTRPYEKKGVRLELEALADVGGLNQHLYNAARGERAAKRGSHGRRGFPGRDRTTARVGEAPGLSRPRDSRPGATKGAESGAPAVSRNVRSCRRTRPGLRGNVEQARLETEISHQEQRAAFTGKIRERDARIREKNH